MDKTLLCFGMGYSAEVLAGRLAAEGWRIKGTSQGSEKAEALRKRGFDIRILSTDTPLSDARAYLEDVTHILTSVPPGEAGDPIVNLMKDDLIEAEDISWIAYLSTTGVYGTRGGGWVDEESELRPTSDRSRRRVAAEAEWIALHERYGLPVHIFRLAGIYGPGRNTLETLRKGEGRRIVRPGQVFSRIHVEDIAKVLEASIASPAPGRIYNVCDDCAEEPARVVEFACKLLGIEPPEAEDFAQADLSPMARTFWADNKRVSNRRIHEELKVELSYPDYKAGLRALLNA